MKTKWIKLFQMSMWVLAFGVWIQSASEAVPIVFQNHFYSQARQALLDGVFDVTANLRTSDGVYYTERKSLVFKNGFFTLRMGESSVVTPSIFNRSGLFLEVLTGTDVATFSITAIPYSIRSSVAEQVNDVPASSITGEYPNLIRFLDTVRVQSPSESAPIFDLWVTPSARLGIGSFANRSYSLTIGGVMNSAGLYVNGVPLEQTLKWRKDLSVSGNIYNRGSRLGIGNSFPGFDVHVGDDSPLISSSDTRGFVNATTFLLDGKRLSFALDWKPTSLGSIYYQDLSALIGLGTPDPQERLDIIGALHLGSAVSKNQGTIQWTGSVFQGVNTSNEWVSLGGIVGTGNSGFVSIWRDPILGGVYNELGVASQLRMDPTQAWLRVGTDMSTVPRFGIREFSLRNTYPIFLINSLVTPAMFVVSNNGHVGVGTANPRTALSIVGAINAESYTIGGEPLDSISANDYWFRNSVRGSIYYNRGNVGIGRPDPTSLLEIAQPNNAPYIDPAITFSDVSSRISYTMGVSAGSQNTFRIERGGALGASRPLFVAQADRFGIGVDPPRANLHVSGNAAIFNGAYAALGAILPLEGVGTRMQWFPSRLSFIAGRLAAVSGNSESTHVWDQVRLSEGGIGLGSNPIPSGTYSTVLGGDHNTAGGAYSTILGGRENVTSGDFSVAGGLRASAAHHGSFVWSSPTTTEFSQPFFETRAENQFLIRANGGVGIGTSLTSLTALVITANSGKIVNFIGSGDHSFWISSSGNMGIDYTGTTSRTLTVGGAFRVGAVSTSTGAHSGMLLVRTELNSTADVFALIGDSGFSSPNFVVDYRGIVGIGSRPFLTGVEGTSTLNEVPPPVPNLQIFGQIVATDFILPDGTSLLNRMDMGWVTGSSNTVYFVSNNVGIGMTRPSQVLSLSNRGGLDFGISQQPGLGFDISNQLLFTLGMHSSSPQVFRVVSGSSLASASVMAVSGNRIGFGTDSPQSLLHVEPRMWVSGSVMVLASPLSTAYALDLSGARAKTSEFYINRRRTTASGASFLVVTTNIGNEFLFFSNASGARIGIGTATPQAELDVSGTIKVVNSRSTSLIVDRLQIDNDLTMATPTSSLKFVNALDGSFAQMYIDAGALLVKPAGSNIISLSSSIASGTGPEGPMSLWLNDPGTPSFSFLVEADGLRWKNATSTQDSYFKVTGNLSVFQVVTSNTGTVTQDVSFGASNFTTFLSETSSLTRPELFNNSFSYVHKQIDTSMVRDAEGAFLVRGKSIVLSQPTGSFFQLRARAVGLVSDVSGVGVQEGANPGFRYSGIFLNTSSQPVGSRSMVGIGVTPSVELEVKGTLFATTFNITNRLTVATLNMGSILDMTKTNRVGVGTSTSLFPLAINGILQSSFVSINAVIANSMAINQAFFFVGEGQVGMGTTRPTAEWHLNRTFTGLTDRDFSFQTIGVSVNRSDLNRPVTGLSIGLSSVGSRLNFLGDRAGGVQTLAKGISVDLSRIELETTENVRSVTGIRVAVSTGNISTRNSAVFLGGNVGVGTQNPTVALEVLGSISADNVNEGSLLTDQEGAIFQNLVNPTLRVNGPVQAQNMFVERLQYKNLVAPQTLDLSNLDLNLSGSFLAEEFRVTSNLFVSTLNISQGLYVSGNSTFVGLGIGLLSESPASGLRILGAVRVPSASVVDGIVSVVKLAANDHVYLTSSGVGINRRVPISPLDVIVSNPDTSFSASTISSWNPIIVESTGNVAGVVFLPDASQDEVTSNVGSGIAAVRKVSLGVTGSELVLITDPINGLPQEQMRFVQNISGNSAVGIGTTQPRSELDVSGDVRIRGGLVFVTDNPTVRIARIQSSGFLTISRPVVEVSATTNVRNRLSIKNGVYLLPYTNPGRVTDAMALTVVPVSNSLNIQVYFPDSGFVSSPLGDSVGGIAGSLPYYTTNHRLVSTDGPLWVTYNIQTAAAGSLRFRSQITQVTSSMLINVTPSLASRGYVGQSVTLSFLARKNASVRDTVFVGTDIVARGTTLNIPESAVGVRVFIDKIATRSFGSSGVPVTGKLVAASFLTGSQSSGNVGVYSQPTPGAVLRPSADLYVEGNASTQNVFLVNNALQVGYLGNVGIGTSFVSTSAVRVKGDGRILDILDSNSRSLISGRVILPSVLRMGIGVSTPQASLDILGTLTAKTLISDEGSFGRLLVGTIPSSNPSLRTLSILNSGFVGIGVLAPISLLETFHQYLVPDEAIPTVFSSISLSQTASFNSSVSGISLKTDSLGVPVGKFVSSGGSNYIRGLHVDLTALSLFSTSNSLVGVSVNVASRQGSSSAIFKGGNVGIGVSIPTVALDVAGDIRARSIISGTKWVAAQVSLNTLVVTSDAVVSQDITMGKLVATTLNANARMRVNQLVVGDGSLTRSWTLERAYADVQFLLATQNVDPSIVAPAKVLFVSSANGGELVYSRFGKRSVLGEVYPGFASKIPAYDSLGVVAGQSPLVWTGDTNRLSLNVESIANNTSTTLYETTISKTSTQSVTLAKIHTSFSPRLGTAATAFHGVNIAFNNPIPASGMSAVDSSVGLRVDMSGLRFDTSTQLPGTLDRSIHGTRTAATFMAGADALSNVAVTEVWPAVAASKPNSDLFVESSRGAPPFRVDIAANRNAFGVSSDGRVLVGGPKEQILNAWLGVRSLISTVSAFSIRSNQNVPLVYFTPSGNLGMGTTEPGATWHIVAKSAATPILDIRSKLVVSRSGLVGMGTTVPSASIHVKSPFTVSSSSSLFLVGTSNLKFEVNDDSKVGVGSAASPTFSMVVNRRILSGTTTENLPLEWSQFSVLSNFRGFLANTGTGYGVIGLRGGQRVLGWGEGTDFIFEGLQGTSREIMRLTSSLKMGIGTASPSARVHVQGTLANPPFQVGVGSVTGSIFVLGNRNIGISSANPSSALVVSGSIQVDSILDASPNGTIVEALSLDVSSNLGVTSNSKIQYLLTSDQAANPAKVHLQISQDVTSDMVAFAVVATGSVSSSLTAPTNHLVGLTVRLDNELITYGNPAFGTVTGNKIAAVFLGGAVGVGAIATPDSYAVGTTNILSIPALQVRAMTQETNLIASTGNMIGFSSVSSGNVYRGSTLGISNWGLVTASMAISPYAFVSAGLSPTGSVAVFDDLRTKKLISSTSNRVTTNVAAISAYTAPFGTDSIIRGVLALHVSRLITQMAVSTTNSVATNSILLANGQSTNNSTVATLSSTVGQVGIGFVALKNQTLSAMADSLSQLDKSLVVSGDMRVGELISATIPSDVSQGDGSVLTFSGGPGFKQDSDNADDLWIARFNRRDATTQFSELRINVGESNTSSPNAKFSIVQVASYNEQVGTVPLTVMVSGYADSVSALFGPGLTPPDVVGGLLRVGRVGLGTTLPASTLHVKGDALYIGSTANLVVANTRTTYFEKAKSVMLIENPSTANLTGTDAYNLMAIQFSQTNNLDTRAFYLACMQPSSSSGIQPLVSGVVYYKPNTLLGGVQVSDDQGAWYASSQADYAEYLPKLNPTETLLPGDIVGVVSGRVTREMAGAQHIMVLSTSPIVVGNHPGTQNIHAYALTSFMGQVSVRVRGAVLAGDYIVPSGLSDGEGRAIAPALLAKQDIPLIVGRVLEDNTETGHVRPVKILIGFPYASQKMGGYVKEIKVLETRISALEEANKTLQRVYLEKLKSRQALIESLEKKVVLVKQS